MDETGYLKPRVVPATMSAQPISKAYGQQATSKDHTYRQAITSAASGCQAALDMPNVGSTATAYKHLSYALLFKT